MKKLTFTMLAAILAFFIIQSCRREITPIGDGSLKASKTIIGVGYIDTLLFTGATATDSVQWTVTPTDYTSITTKANTARVVFDKAGTYTVTAKKNNGKSAGISIKVVDNAPIIYNDTSTTKSDITTTSTLDTVKIEPIKTDIYLKKSFRRNPDGPGTSINLTPYINVTNYYCLKALLQYKATITDDNHFNLVVINVRESKGCTILPPPAGAPPTEPPFTTAQYDVFVKKYIEFGTYPLTVTVNNVTYTGSVTISELKVTFYWPYTSGVIMQK